MLTEIAFEHGWIELPDGTVLDPTLVRYTRNQAEEMYRLTLPWVYRDRQFGRTHPGYVRARDLAFAELLQSQSVRRAVPSKQ